MRDLDASQPEPRAPSTHGSAHRTYARAIDCSPDHRAAGQDQPTTGRGRGRPEPDANNAERPADHA